MELFKNIRITWILITVSFAVLACDSEKSQYEVHNKHLENAVLFTQHAPEYKALCYQAYNAAGFQLMEILNQYEGDNKPAVVLDIDETVLDNSPYVALQLLEGISYPDCWDEWCMKEEALLIPGVDEFLKLADSLGLSIFYISNRKEHLLQATINNLKKRGLPQAGEENILLRKKESSKESRRKSVEAQGFDILMLAGDNLADFSKDFDDNNIDIRNELAQEQKNQFGKFYIVLPNISYGSWEGSLGLYEKNLNQDSLRRTLFKGFQCQ